VREIDQGERVNKEEPRQQPSQKDRGRGAMNKVDCALSRWMAMRHGKQRSGEDISRKDDRDKKEIRPKNGCGKGTRWLRAMGSYTTQC
jgi:hypothetical protein